MCHGGCGVLVTVENGTVVGITGDPDSPLNRGKICPKAAASIEHLYHPDRLRYPLKRKGRRGEGKWERISWDDALGSIADKIRTYAQEYGTESIALGMGTGRHHFQHVLRFANALGTPNWCEPGTAQCFVPRVLTGLMTYGDLPVCDYYGDVNPACLMVWGHNPVISGPDGEIQFRVRECLSKGTKLIVVDPRRTELAEKADLWLQVRPGTDDALALSMLSVIISEGIYDRDFVDEWTVGFDQLAERVADYTPEWAESITWVPADRIIAAARLFAESKPGAIEWGVALEHTPNCLQTVRAVALLPAVTGNIDIPGGWAFGMHILRPLDTFASHLPQEMKRKRMGADRFGVLCGEEALIPSAHIPTLFEAMRTGEPYPVKAFLIFGNNGLVTYANAREVHETLTRVDFLSVMDIYMTPTAALADIVLPAATWLEVDEVVGVPYVAENVVLVQQKVAQVGESRMDEEVLAELARRLDLKAGAGTVRADYDRQLSSLGITFDELKETGHIVVPISYEKHRERGFRTPSGKIELAASYLERLGYDPLPYYEEPPESPVSTPEIAREYPLVLTTGARSQYFFHSEYRQIDSLRKRHPYPIVEIHPAAAKRHGIEADDWVWIETLRGRIRQKARITDKIDPRVIHVEHAWWFPEEAAPEFGAFKSNANVLTSNAPPYDPAIGTYQLRALLCRISKAPAEDQADPST